jgi:hypothetical protein
VGLGIGFILLLFVLGITAGDEKNDSGGSDRAGDAATPSRSGSGKAKGNSANGTATTGATGRRASELRPVRMSVVAARPVWVCLVDAKGEALIGGRTLAGGNTEGPFRSKRFRLTVGNGGADLRVNGRKRDLPETSKPLGYSISDAGLRRLPAARQPTCEPGA